MVSQSPHVYYHCKFVHASFVNPPPPPQKSHLCPALQILSVQHLH